LLDVPARSIDLPGWFRIGPTVAGGPVITFQPVSDPKTGKARAHLDIWVDDLDTAVDLVGRLGGSTTGERHDYQDGTVMVMRDPEGNEFCVVAEPWRQ
jgi:predicted enzyme related to lactoylglutathione lyase